MNRYIITLALLALIGCTTTGHVGNWQQVTIAMSRDDVHALLGAPDSTLTRKQWDVAVVHPDGTWTAKQMVVLSSSMLCQFQTVDRWVYPESDGDYLEVYYSKTGKVLRRVLVQSGGAY